MGSVWRADRPQKGRFRQFVQCDIDILGDATSLAEIELILATTTALGRICPDNGFTVRINDRGILRGMALYCGFAEESMDQVFITLDKMDKIGLDGVAEELAKEGLSAMEAWMKELGLAMKLSEIGVTMEMIDDIVNGTLIMEGGYKVLSKEDVRKVLMQSM